MNFYYFPGVQLLLVNETNQTVEMLYNDNPYTWPMALIGDRPPYYADPIHIEEYPVL